MAGMDEKREERVILNQYGNVANPFKPGFQAPPQQEEEEKEDGNEKEDTTATG